MSERDPIGTKARNVRVRLRVVLAVIAALALGAGISWGVRRALRPKVLPPTAEMGAQAQRVRILRDRWGVPHVFGERDADAAFGLAYAHAEDDWPTIQGLLIAGRGQWSRVSVSEAAIVSDYFVRLIRVEEQVEEQYPALSPELRQVFEAYALGLSYYAAKHPDEVDSRFLPYTGKDVAAGFVFKLPYLLGLGDVIGAVAGAKTGVVAGGEIRRNSAGSNAHAVASQRSADGITRLNINSHQPWEGPVAWYEAHVVSREGWNMTGGLFPGSPFVLHGHNDHLGWAHTVNSPDLIDVYRLETDPARPHEYRYDGEWRKLEVSRTPITIDLGVFAWRYERPAYSSVHGPVLETDHGTYAFRYAGIGRMLRAAEQWFRMNKAATFAEWKSAMQMQGLPSFNTVYADADNVYYVYNALLPRRSDRFDWKKMLPGDTSAALWTDYVSYTALPSVENPAAGFVQNCNSTPFFTTRDPDNPRREGFPAWMGIEDTVNNRALRSHALFGGDASITRDEFIRYKWDAAFAPGAPVYARAIAPVLSRFVPRSEAEKQGLELLRGFDGRMDPASRSAALVQLTFGPVNRADPDLDTVPDPVETFRSGVEFLVQHFGRVDVPLGEVQRIRRGSVDQPLGGGEDVLNAVRYETRDGRLIGVQGDSYVLIAEFPRGAKARSWAVHQYGNVNRPSSPHYADQIPLYLRHEMRESLRTEAAVRRELAAAYNP
jgi:acyl-homoserine-lactone acylase